MPPKVFTLETAYEQYAKYKDADKNQNLQKYLNRSKTDLIKVLGKVAFSGTPMIKLTRSQALTYRDALLDRVAPASVERYVTTVKAVINHAIDELGLQMNNPFNRLKVKGAAATARDRQSLSETDVMAVRNMIAAEDLKALYEALCATGARLSEVCGMECGDMNLQDRAIHIKPNSIRTLKNCWE
ncbi:Phage integrase [Rhodobacterales bacterium HTCC2150]|nr:Phage integrase [Rhodobacterales bacterium HTCC2150] [Rhodobacteraceae bacterium HTCC2150]